MKQPAFTEEEFENALEDAEETQETFSELLNEAEAAANASDRSVAATKFDAALNMSPHNPYLRQQTALHTYKSKLPSEPLALMAAKQILDPLKPDSSNDPETLGMSGAIHKRLWFQNKDRATLDLAIHYYQKGFELRGDYYNCGNAAICLELRSSLQDDENEVLFDRMLATKIRRAVAESLFDLVASSDFGTRDDCIWIFATLANCLFALPRVAEATEFEAKFLALNPANWQKRTYFEGKKTLLEVHKLNSAEE